MTRSNIHIHLSSGQFIQCVADSSSAPEQGYFIEEVLQPLVTLRNPEQELQLLQQHCTMDEQRANATYRYPIDLRTGQVRFFEENYHYNKDRFFKGNDLTSRLTAYCSGIPALRTFLQSINRIA